MAINNVYTTNTVSACYSLHNSHTFRCMISISGDSLEFGCPSGKPATAIPK